MTATWIFAGLSLACWALFLYPYLIYPQILKLLSKRPIRPAPIQLPVSLLFCAHNELECLPQKLENLWRLKRSCSNLQILVYDDASTDETPELLAGCDDPRLRVLRHRTAQGVAANRNSCLARARGPSP